MTIFKSVLLSICCTLFFHACVTDSPTLKLDASSEEAMKRSEERITRYLPKEEREKFTEAMETLREVSEFNVATRMMGNIRGTSFLDFISIMKSMENMEEKVSKQAEINLRKKLHGKTAHEIIQMAEETRKSVLNLGGCLINGMKGMCNENKGIEFKIPEFYKFLEE